MNKAFLFDMDGVLVDSERISIVGDHDFFAGVFGADIADKIGDAMGLSVDTVYQKAVANGASMEKEVYLQKCDERSASIYARADLIAGSDQLAAWLISHGFKLGLVSATRRKWIDHTLARLRFQDAFETVISINDVPGLKSKPEPDGFLEALRRLNADPKRSIVLEDSNRGIASGKAAGCYVIGYRGHLVDGYEQTGADAYAETMRDVIGLVESFDGD
jgi:beta-phosphoglucomutase